jgi:hypothetical protein
MLKITLDKATGKVRQVMNLETLHRMDDLSQTDVQALTNILSLPFGEKPTASWLAAQANLIDDLPPHLRRQRDIITRLTLAFSHDKAILCPDHKGLDGKLIRHMFITIARECTEACQKLSNDHSITGEVREFVQRLRSINSLWTEPNMYRILFDNRPNAPKLDFLRFKCEACIISTVSSDARMLKDLLIASITRRRKSQVRQPRLCRFVEAWLEHRGVAEQVRADSEELINKVREARRAVQMVQKAKKHEKKSNPDAKSTRSKPTRPASNPFIDPRYELDGKNREDDKGEEHDDNAVIIDFYRHKFNNCDFLNQDPRELSGHNADNFRASRASLHPAFRGSDTSDTTVVDEQNKPNTWYPDRYHAPSRPYSPSIYSEHPYAHSELDSGATARRAERFNERAEAYRTLVGREGGSLDQEEENLIKKPSSSTFRRYEFEH